MVVSTFKSSKAEKEKYKQAAALFGESFSEFMRRSANYRIFKKFEMDKPELVEKLLRLFSGEGGNNEK